MGQEETFNFLKNLRVKGDESFFTIKDIHKGLGDEAPNMNNVARQVNCLYAWGYLEISLCWSKSGGMFQRKFRVKQNFLKKDNIFRNNA